MYKSTTTYQWGKGNRVCSTHMAFTKTGALLKAWFYLKFKNNKFFNISVELADI